MHTESSPASAESSLGPRLRALRLSQNLTVEEVGARLKLPMAIIEAIERDDQVILGAAVFARGRVGSYARLLGMPSAVVDAQFAKAAIAPPPLISATRDSRFERSLQRVARQGIYVVLTATIVLPVIWLATLNHLPQSAASLTSLDAPMAAGKTARNADSAAATTAFAAEPRNQPPIAASMAPFGSYRGTGQPEGSGIASPTTIAAAAAAASAAVSANGLQLRFSGDSWVDLVAPDGHTIEHGVIEAGSVRNYPAGTIAKVSIGNAGSVLVLQNGQPFDLAQFSRANVARFTLSSDGKLVPAGN
jgi:cytoskeleton protein RodZ